MPLAKISTSSPTTTSPRIHDDLPDAQRWLIKPRLRRRGEQRAADVASKSPPTAPTGDLNPAKLVDHSGIEPATS